MDANELQSSLNQYQNQLSQVNAALNVISEGDEFDSLTSLKSDLLELISLTNENIDKLTSQKTKSAPKSDVKTDKLSSQDATSIDDEYALFMSEMMESGAYDNPEAEKNTNEKSEDINHTDIEDELASLEGKKCSVYFTHKWGGAPSLYNAMVCSVIKDEINDSTKYDDIKVRIMFTNPTHIEMVPCPYYLDGECKFDEDDCRFSHGEIIPLSTLQEAVQPNFVSLKPGSRILAKINKIDEPMSNKQSEKYMLWHRAAVKSINLDKHVCRVKLENDVLFKSGTENDYEVEFGHVFPLNDDSVTSDVDSDSTDDSDTNEDLENPSGSTENDNVVEISLLNKDPTKLGDWEKYTKGMGSKLMMKMGYIVGTGLGPQGEGRLHPVQCRITPSGRSLDHCMELREEAQNEDPLKTEKRLLKKQKKKEEGEKKAYERLKNREKHDVFNFLNNTLAKNPTVKNNSNVKEVADIKSSSCKSLNIERFKLDEDIKKTEKEIVKIKDSMSRNIKNTSVHRGLSVKLTSKLEEMENLKKRQTSISNEQSNRKDQRKLTIF